MRHRRVRPRSVPTLLALAVAAALAAPAAGQLRVVCYNVAQLNGNLDDLGDVLDELQDDTRPGFVAPVSIFCFQEVQLADWPVLLDLVAASAPPGVPYSGGTFTVAGNESNFAGAQAMIYRADQLQEIIPGHDDIFTGAGRFTDRWQMKLVGYDSPDAQFYVYSAHLSASNFNERVFGVGEIRENLAELPLDTHAIVLGDFNFSSSAEDAYVDMLAFGVNAPFDPLPGPWLGSANALKHTQAPCDSGCALIGGGMDDRFDIQFSTFDFQDGEGLTIIPGTYRAFGNDGNHWNEAINDGTNSYFPDDIPRSNALADDLHDASDHIPVVVDYQVPALATTFLAPSFGRVVQGASHTVLAGVANDAPVDDPIGAAVLDYVLAPSGAITGVVVDDAVALAGFNFHDIDVDTSTVGQDLVGTLNVAVTGEGAQVAAPVLQTTGTVVRPANASFSDVADEDAATVEVAVEPDTGVQVVEVDVFNLGFDADQSLLDVDDVAGVAAPASFAGGLATGLGAGAATLSFEVDTAGLAPGRLVRAATITTSDEDIPGETVAVLALDLVITVGGAAPCPGDVVPSGEVDVSDLLAVLGAWGACPEPCTPGVADPDCPADTNLDCTVGVNDLLEVLGAWGPCP